MFTVFAGFTGNGLQMVALIIYAYILSFFALIYLVVAIYLKKTGRTQTLSRVNSKLKKLVLVGVILIALMAISSLASSNLVKNSAQKGERSRQPTP